MIELYSNVWDAAGALISLPSSELMYVSGKFTDLTGITNHDIEIKKKNTFNDIIESKDFSIVENVHKKTVKLFNKLHYNHTSDNFIFSQYNIKLRVIDGTYQNISIYVKPAFYSKYGVPTLAYIMCVPEQKYGHDRFVIENLSKKQSLYFSSTSNKFADKEVVSLRKIESDILLLISKGYNETKIAGEIGVKLDLVKYYKKSIYKKLHVSSVNEAIYIALRNRLID